MAGFNPENTSAIFRPALQALANEYADDKASKKFIAHRAAPKFMAPFQKGDYPIFLRENFKKRHDNARGATGKFNRIGGEFGKGSYNCENHGLEFPIDDRKRKEYANLFNAESAGTRVLMFQMLLNWEYRVHAAYVAAGLSNTNVSTAWSTVASGVPLTDIETGTNTLSDASGVSKADISLIIPRADFQEMLKTDQVIDKSKYTFRLGDGVQPSQLEATQVAAMLGIREVVIAESVQDSANVGITESDAQIWTAGVMYLAVLAEESDDINIPSFMRTFINAQYTADLPIVESYRDETAKSDIVRMEDDTDEATMAETDLLAYKLTNT